MWLKNKKYHLLEKAIEELNNTLIKSNLIEISNLLGNKKKLLFNNLLAGIARGVGIGIGVTIITAILVVLLQKIVAVLIVMAIDKNYIMKIGLKKILLYHIIIYRIIQK